MKKHLLFLAAFLSLLTASQAQSTRIKWKQVVAGTQGQIAIVGTDGNGTWVTPVFTKWSDTLTYLATKSDIVSLNNKEVTNGGKNSTSGVTTLTKRDGSTVTWGDGYSVPLAQKAAINGVATLGADGKVPSAQLPALPGRETYVVSTQSAMLALSATKGDFAIRTDQNKTYVLQSTPASTLANWVELPQNLGITSVNGDAGPNVTLTTDNISEGSTNKYFLDSRARLAVSASAPLSYNSGTGIFSHAASGVTASTYNNVTVDINGHVVNGSNVSYLTASNLANYYTKTELQTNGQAAVVWGNITGKPANLGAQEVKQTLTNGTSSVITMTQTPLYATAVLVFLNGVLLDPADYSISGATLTLGFPRETTDAITYKFSY